MLARLPKFIDPLLFADKCASIEGQLVVNSFDRMAELLTNDTDNVTFKLFFSREGKLAKVEGRLSAVLALKCQRCLEALEWSVNSDIKLGIVSSLSQADNLPQGYEPLLLIEDAKISLHNLIEDELLLNVPAIPKHQNDCIAPDSRLRKTEILPEGARTKPENPFSILAKLKLPETNNGSTKK